MSDSSNLTTLSGPRLGSFWARPSLSPVFPPCRSNYFIGALVYQEFSGLDAEASIPGLGPISHNAEAPITMEALSGYWFGLNTRVESILSQLQVNPDSEPF